MACIMSLVLNYVHDQARQNSFNDMKDSKTNCELIKLRHKFERKKRILGTQEVKKTWFNLIQALRDRQ